MDSRADRAVREIMTADPTVVAPDLSVKDAARAMVEHGVGALPVLQDGALVGIVTEGDLISQDLQLEYPTYIHLLDGMVMYPPVATHLHDTFEKATSATVEDVMTRKPFTVSPDATVADVSALMIERDIGRVPVVEGGALVGIVSKSDIVRSLIAG